MTTANTFLRRNTYSRDDDGEELISKSTWSMRLSGIIAGVLLVIGRSASYGNITWQPAYHPATSGLVVIVKAAPSSKTP
ncbi:MAG TPA: hypothetical protein VET65_10175, partial [Candidatus Limnocylindrales bacterium]|nr:hypothetical protein [Candidatus Limnocylindrales bacterium]